MLIFEAGHTAWPAFYFAQMGNFNSHTDFFDISYLQYGSAVQQEVFSLLKASGILGMLSTWQPVLAGTIPIGVNIPGSDLDILCSFTDKELFMQDITNLFGEEAAFTITEMVLYGHDCVVANFDKEGYPIEIFAQALPVQEQMGYRHMLIEHRLLLQYGESLRQQVIRLKLAGYKTEPAFCEALGIRGNAYLELLKLEDSTSSL
ncbi:DUF4269 domain-containing protein [Chitinophaga rhizophila]|uniref:DUF4269 domain-containing protein n=1 Tax=Chitinophaga rhizophila TaxID=2866212 RepID=A0ABS7GKD6_9BACT|nr:DUF4269 domain-containing protein [Chitinophaga rhizophila]MBW8687575.1 DUF4269 domain-containing protein [Chitinophaga rhizophila]